MSPSEPNQMLAVDGVTLEGNGRLDLSYNPGGGGMHVRPGSSTPITVSNSLIRGNRNWGNAGGVEFWGPQTNYMANAIISNTTLENNTTLLDGANGRGFGGAIASIGNTNLTVTSSTIQGNASYSGGGIFLAGSTSINDTFAGLTVIDSTIPNNQSTTEGGGITQRTGQTQIQGSTIAENSGNAGGLQMTVTGGQISNTTISGNNGGAYGGAYLTSRNALLIANSTVTANFGFSIGGVHSTGSAVQFLNSIVAQNGLTSSEGFPGPFQESDLTGAIRSLGHNITTDEDSPTIIDVLANDFELDGESFSVVRVQDAQGGTAVINQHGTILFTPAADFNGVATFSYVLEDAAGLQSVAQVSVSVIAVNDAPVAQDDVVILDEDTLAQIGVLTNDSDIDGDSLTVSQILTAPANGTVTINSAGQLVYSPKVDYSGTDSFVYEISDGNGGTTTAAVTVTVISRHDQLNALKAKVQQLLDTGVINSKQSRTLQGYLKFSKDVGQTVGWLNQFQTEVQKLINNQTLSSTIGQMLIADAEKLKLSVSIFASTGGGGGNGKGRK